MKPAGADGDEGLIDVESGALRIEVGMHEGEHAGAAPRHPEKQRGERRRGGGDGEEEILPVHAGKDEHHGGDSANNKGGAEIGLLHDQQHENDGHHGGAQQGVAPVVHLVEPRGKKPGEKENDDGLGDLRGLEVKKRRSESSDGYGASRERKELPRAAGW